MADLADRRLGVAPQLCDLRVAEAVLLREAKRVDVELAGGAHEVRDLVDQHDLVEEPRVDARRLEQLRHSAALAQCLLDDDDAPVGRGRRDLDQLVERAGLVAPVEARSALLERAERLLQGGRVVAADRHRLADRLHGRRERRVGGRELLEVEARHLHDDVVQSRLEARRRHLRDVVRDLVEPVADRELRGDLRDREAGRLRGERRRARDAGVHLDHDDAAVRGVDGELDVAATRVDADRADDVDADVAQLLILAIGERERGGDGDRVAGVHADRVDVLDRADHDRVVGRVAHELELVLLPPEDRLLEQHLCRRRVAQTRAGDATQIVLVVGEARPESAHRERGTHHERVAELGSRGQAVLDRVRDAGCRDIGPGIQHELLEDLAVLALVDRLEARADELDVVLVQDAVIVQVDRGVQRRLPAQGRQDRVGALLRDDRLDHLPRDRLDVGGVGEVGVGHDRGRVGVDQDDANALLAQHAARLGSGVVELAGLADHDRAGADDENALDVVALRHSGPSGSRRRGHGTGRRGSWRRGGRPRLRGGTAPRRPGCRARAGPRRRRRSGRRG